MSSEFKDTLKLTISSQLRKTIGLDGDDRPLDYFDLLGVSRLDAPAETIESNLRERTRVLRQWQNSPEFGREVVRLLPALHRAAKILLDSRRREAYRKELELEEKGETIGGIERFRELARVALVGSEISANDRQTLQQFAYQHGLDAAQMRTIIEEVRQDYETARQSEPQAAAAAEAAEEEWEFRLAGEGEEAFQIMLTGLKASNSHIGLSTKKLVEDGLSYGIDVSRAQQIVQSHQRAWFRDMVRLIAGEGVISEAQTRLLLPKAADYGLSEQQAYEIISDYSLTAVASDALMRQFKLAEEAFSAEDISSIIEETAARRRRRSWLRDTLPDMAIPRGIGLKVGGGVLALVVLAVGWAAIHSAGESHRSGTTVKNSHQGPIGGGKVDAATPSPTSTPTPSPSPTPQARIIPNPVPDPSSGLLRFDPEQAGDPPSFEIAITEVTCDTYSSYLNSVLETPPPGWPPTRMPPAGRIKTPVTDVTWPEAKKFCDWVASKNGWLADSVRLPTLAEFKRATRGVTIRGHGNPQSPDYWDIAHLGLENRPHDVTSFPWDRILFANLGQMYDFLGNVAEWGYAPEWGDWPKQEKGGDKRLVLGGSFNDKNPDFNPFEPRWLPPDNRLPWLGFRYVHMPGQ